MLHTNCSRQKSCERWYSQLYACPLIVNAGGSKECKKGRKHTWKDEFELIEKIYQNGCSVYILELRCNYVHCFHWPTCSIRRLNIKSLTKWGTPSHRHLQQRNTAKLYSGIGQPRRTPTRGNDLSAYDMRYQEETAPHSRDKTSGRLSTAVDFFDNLQHVVVNSIVSLNSGHTHSRIIIDLGGISRKSTQPMRTLEGIDLCRQTRRKIPHGVWGDASVHATWEWVLVPPRLIVSCTWSTATFCDSLPIENWSLSHGGGYRSSRAAKIGLITGAPMIAK